MTIINRLIFFSVILIALTACSHKSQKHNNIDPFYSEKGEWDSGVIPLLKPYQAIITNKNMGWCMNMDGYDGDTGFQGIKSANVLNGVIYVYSVNSILHGVDYKESWHVIIPAKHIEKGFGSFREYIQYLNLIKVPEPKLYDIEEVASFYHSRDVMDWQEFRLQAK